MTFSISIADAGISFPCAGGETVLDAAERAGYAIPYSCRKGLCSTCEGRLLSGAAVVRGQGMRAGPAEGVLLCQARPCADLLVAPAWIRKVEPVSRKMLEVKVRRIDRPIPDIAVIHLRLPIGQRAVFRAGQYLRILLPDGDSRNYSMANSPHRNDELELHIRRVPGGKFSDGVLTGLDKASRLTIELPYGEFRLGDSPDGRAILIATGTGFAPIKSIIEHQIHLGATRPLHLYWGANTEADLYMADLPRKWAEAYPWFQFTPVISAPADGWAGRTGFVHLAVLDDYSDMTGLEVYACGAPVAIDAALRAFTGLAGLKRDAFFSDAFVPSGDITEEPAAAPAAEVPAGAACRTLA